MTEDMLVFNGIDVDTGGYLFPPTPLATLASGLRHDVPTGSHVARLRRRAADDEDHLGLMWGSDADRLESAGWALVTCRDEDPAVLAALEPLRTLRQSQAGDRYRELVVNPGEDDDAFLTGHGMAPGPADPRRVPYYLLLVGDPEAIPFRFQYQMDVEYAVGRLHFDTLAEYAAYAQRVVTAETAPAAAAPAARRVHLFGTRNAGDTATALSAARLVAPMADELAHLSPGLVVTHDIGATARRDRLLDLLFAADAPPVLFTASHGLGASGGDQRETQGALLCQDWPGPLRRAGRVDENHYLAGRHVPLDRPVRPRVVFSFSCYGAGTPRESDYDAGSVLTERGFVGRLPQRLLGTPAGGALAFIGHVDRAFSCSFLWNGLDPQITALASVMLAVLDGTRIGNAMEYLNSKYAAIATQLTTRLHALRGRAGRLIDDRTLAALWTANHDARNYVLLGDPAVRAVYQT
jgi:hypothetical protein